MALEFLSEIYPLGISNTRTPALRETPLTNLLLLTAYEGGGTFRV